MQFFHRVLMRWNGTILCLLSSLQAQSSEFSFHLQSLCSSSRPSVSHHNMNTLWKCKMFWTVGWATSRMVSSHFIHLNAKIVSYSTISLHNSLQHYLYGFCSVQWLPSHYKHTLPYHIFMWHSIIPPSCMLLCTLLPSCTQYCQIYHIWYMLVTCCMYNCIAGSQFYAYF
jgi:hypothetical protein